VISTPDGVTANKTDLTHFRLARLTRNFFLSRLFKKLGKPFDIKQAERVTDEALAAHWEDYEHVFSQTYRQAVSRNSQGLSRAPTTTASPSAQLQEILRLLAAKR
jgi:hypothetical protein